MKRLLLFLATGIVLSVNAVAQQPVNWTESDRAHLLAELTRSRDELTRETKGLSEKQWNFRDSSQSWSINQVIEHLSIWELLFQREISQALVGGPQPALQQKQQPDSVKLRFLLEEQPHITTEYTKPFTFSMPMGINTGENNTQWFLKMRNESLSYLLTTGEDLRAYYLKEGRGSIHQIYISIYGHTDRHLRQIRKIKANLQYPK
ncbi:MAG: DinB family protein [Chitinophagaceae bacterium]|nr:MAG: DinB family protein [Chitinophagaceae bacterium]